MPTDSMTAERRHPRHPRLPAGRGLQTAANIAVIIAAGCVVWLVFARAVPTGPQPPPTYEIGEPIDAVEGISFRGPAETLLMFVREDCRFCRESEPFYRRLSKARSGTTSANIRLVVASTDSPSALADYLRRTGINVDQVASVRPGQLKIPGTPFLILVNRDGRVARIWRGRLSTKDAEEEVLSLFAP